jgi:hypothetical protein
MSLNRLPVRYQVAAMILGICCGAWISTALAADYSLVTFATRGEITALDVHVDIIHPSPGDLHLVLHYDYDRDGMVDASAPLSFHLAYHEGGTLPTRWSVPAKLDGVYAFHFGQVQDGLDEEDRLVLSRFVGLAPSGEFYLEAVDSKGSADRSIREWNVDIRSTAKGSVLVPE